MTKQLERTDPHRPGAIIPANYQFKCWYVLPTTDDPGYTQALVALRATRPVWFQHPSWGSSDGKCSVCGANYRTGEVWQHTPTGEHIHIGHDCAQKYELLNAYAEREIAAWHKQQTQMRAVAIAERRHAAAREQRRRENPDLFARLEALKAHEHASNFARNFASDQIDHIDRKGWMPTEKQLALLSKLEAEAIERANQPVEVHIPTPEGRVEFEGEIVSVKEHESDFGLSTKMTVKVTTPEGVWLAWMTVPAVYYDIAKGTKVRVRATLKHGKDSFFAFGKRPTILWSSDDEERAKAAQEARERQIAAERHEGPWTVNVAIDRGPARPVYRAQAKHGVGDLYRGWWMEVGCTNTAEQALQMAREFVERRGGTVESVLNNSGQALPTDQPQEVK